MALDKPERGSIQIIAHAAQINSYLASSPIIPRGQVSDCQNALSRKHDSVRRRIARLDLNQIAGWNASTNPFRIALAGGVLKYFSRYRLGTCLKSGIMKLNTPPQREEFTSNILCRLALSFGSTTNAKRRGRTLTVALSI
jgi:hypothetical protein